MTTTTHSSSELSHWMLKEHGPLLGGRDLHAALGFRTYAAFHRAYQKEEIGVQVFVITGRRGLFALTADVASWLEQQPKQGKHQRKQETAMPK